MAPQAPAVLVVGGTSSGSVVLGGLDCEYDLSVKKIKGILAVPPQSYPPPPRNKSLIAGLIKGNQWLIVPDHKAGYFLGGGSFGGGVG